MSLRLSQWSAGLTRLRHPHLADGVPYSLEELPGSPRWKTPSIKKEDRFHYTSGRKGNLRWPPIVFQCTKKTCMQSNFWGKITRSLALCPHTHWCGPAADSVSLQWPRQIRHQPSRSATTLGAALSAASIWDWSLPPASAISGFPPPEPPTNLATAPTSFPA